MDYKSLKTLEYHKIIEKLSSYAGSEAARKMCADLKPMTDINSINDALTQTSDALSRIYAKGSVSFSGVTNIIDSIKRLEASVFRAQDLYRQILLLSHQYLPYNNP